MQRIPLELKTKIVTECTIPSWKALRLTDKRFEEIAAPLLFEDIWIGLHSQSALHLRQLGGSERVGLVKQITFVGDLMPVFIDFEEWGSRIYLRPRCEGVFGPVDEWSSRHNLSKKQLKYHYRKYAKYLREQRSMLYKPEYGNMLRKLISKMSNLRRITVLSQRWAPGHDDWHHCFWDRVKEKMLVAPGTLIPDFEAGQFYSKFVLNTLNTLNTKVESFQAGELTPDVWTLNAADTSSQPLQSLAFRTLKHVNLALRYTAYLPEHTTAMAQNVATCLASAEGLKTLNLHTEALCRGYLEEKPEVDFLRPLADMCSEFTGLLNNQVSCNDEETFPAIRDPKAKWPCLESITLDGMETTETSLMAILLPHRKFLKHLGLGFIDFREVSPSSSVGSWRSALQRLSDNFKLETVRFENLEDECLGLGVIIDDRDNNDEVYVSSVENFVLHGGPMPRLDTPDMMGEYPVHDELHEETEDDFNDLYYGPEAWSDGYSDYPML